MCKFTVDTVLWCCQVEANMFVRSLGPVDMVTMQYEAAITLRQKWRDPRLAFTGQVECPGPG